RPKARRFVSCLLRLGPAADLRADVQHRLNRMFVTSLRERLEVFGKSKLKTQDFQLDVRLFQELSLLVRVLGSEEQTEQRLKPRFDCHAQAITMVPWKLLPSSVPARRTHNPAGATCEFPCASPMPEYSRLHAERLGQ